MNGVALVVLAVTLTVSGYLVLLWWQMHREGRSPRFHTAKCMSCDRITYGFCFACGAALCEGCQAAHFDGCDTARKFIGENFELGPDGRTIVPKKQPEPKERRS